MSSPKGTHCPQGMDYGGAKRWRVEVCFARSTSCHLQSDRRLRLTELRWGWAPPISGRRWRGGKLKLNAGGREDSAARQEWEVPIKAWRSSNELMPAIMWWSRLSAQTSGSHMAAEEELEVLSTAASSLSNTVVLTLIDQKIELNDNG